VSEGIFILQIKENLMMMMTIGVARKEGAWSNADTCGWRGVKELANVRKRVVFYYYSSMFCGRSLFVMPNYKS